MRKRFLIASPLVAAAVMAVVGLLSTQAAGILPPAPIAATPCPLPTLPVTGTCPTLAPTAAPPPPPPPAPAPLPSLPSAILPAAPPPPGTSTTGVAPPPPGGTTPAAPGGSPAAPPPAAAPADPGGALTAGGSLIPGLTADAVAGRFAGSPFVDQLLNILAHPIASQPPDLLHFRPSNPGQPASSHGALRNAAGAVLDALAGRGGRGARLALALVGGLLGALAITARATAGGRLALAATLRAGRRLGAFLASPLRLRGSGVSVRRRLAAAALLSVLPVAAAGIAVGAVRHSAPAAQREAAHPAGPAAPAVHPVAGTPPKLAGREVGVQQPPARSPMATPAWIELLGIERGLVAQQDELSRQEAVIARLTRIATNQQMTEDAVGPRSAAGSPLSLDDELNALVGAHQATQAAYQESLKAEYSFYRAAVQDPAKQAQLHVAAAAAPTPDAGKAVDYNVNVVQTQLTQERAIADAQARLAQAGGPGGLQLQVPAPPQTAFLAPETGSIGQPFGPTGFTLEPPLTYRGTFFPHFHTGLDIDAPLDTPLHATAAGVVVLATQSLDRQGHLVGYGNYVVIAHQGGFLSLYGHLDRILVKEGQQVQQGDPIGLEGSTGWSTGPHVHFELRQGNQVLDPAPYIASTLPGAYSQRF